MLARAIAASSRAWSQSASAPQV